MSLSLLSCWSWPSHPSQHWTGTSNSFLSNCCSQESVCCPAAAPQIVGLFPSGFSRTVHAVNISSLCLFMKINHGLEYTLCQSTCSGSFIWKTGWQSAGLWLWWPVPVACSCCHRVCDEGFSALQRFGCGPLFVRNQETGGVLSFQH